MTLASNAVTAAVTLLAVALGGWLSIRNQERLWRRDHARQWRDIRLSAYNEFLSVYRQYLTFVLEPTTRIRAISRSDIPGEPMPFFDESGRHHKENLESTLMGVRLVSEATETVKALDNLVMSVRSVAAARATHSAGDIPAEKFHVLWAAQDAFLTAVRQELGLSEITPHTTKQ